MFVPIWAIATAAAAFLLLLLWTISLVRARNPLPFPDHGSRIFSASSPEAKSAVTDLAARYGLKERFQIDSSGILRSIMWDGTILNYSPPEVSAKLGGAGAGLGFVVSNPVKAAEDAASFLRARGFDANVITDAEPNLPIAFVTTNAMVGTVINFRKHATKMPRPK